MKIVVNADDLGISKEVNNAIFSMLSRGLVTSATILANGPAFEDAIDRIPRYNECSFGVHLNVMEFAPLTSAGTFGGLLDVHGHFSGNIRDISIPKSLRKLILREWCAQVEKVRDAGVNISHLDSHHHVHTIPNLFLALKRVQTKFGIRKVRNTWNIYALGNGVSRTLLLKKKIWALAVKRYYATKMTQGFTDLETFLQVSSNGRLRHFDVEIMVHPGHAGYDEETRKLNTNWPNEVPFKFDLVSYRAL